MSVPKLKVCLTADIEFNVRGALSYPERCQPLGEASVVRPQAHGADAIAALLEPLQRHDLPATFFIETLQSIHFGPGPMRNVVDRLTTHRGADIQLHTHPCWIAFDPERDADPWYRRDSMAGLGQARALEVLRSSAERFRQITGVSATVFRAGNLRADADTLEALPQAGITLSSTLGVSYFEPPQADLRLWSGVHRGPAVTEIPVTSFRCKVAGTTRTKLLTVAGTPFPVMRRLLESAAARQAGPVVFLTHASEMSDETSDIYSPATFRPNVANRERWTTLCRYLHERRDLYDVQAFGTAADQWHSLPPANPHPYTGGLQDAASILFTRAAERVRTYGTPAQPNPAPEPAMLHR